MKEALRMGTRGSALARAQSGQVAAELTRLTGVPVEVVLVKTDEIGRASCRERV